MLINVMCEFYWTVPEVVVVLLLYFHTAVTVILGLTGILTRVSRVRIHRHNLQFLHVLLTGTHARAAMI